MQVSRAAEGLCVFLGCLMAEGAVAENYDFETGLILGKSSTDVVSAIGTIGGTPVPEAGVGTSAADSDTIELFGTWYYSGATDEKGPKSQAAFLSRASNLSIAYSYDDESNSFSSTGTIAPLPVTPPISASFSAETSTLTLGARHVWQDSGWYVLGSFASLDAEFESTDPGGNIFSDDASATAYSAGFGKYLGDATAVDLRVVVSDQDGSNSAAVALAVKHIGSVGESWQYGADVGVIVSDTAGDDQTYLLRLSLFPVDEFEFGAGFQRREVDFGTDGNTYEAFASWFPTDRVELRARYAMNDFDSFVTEEYDNDEIGLGLSIRF